VVVAEEDMAAGADTTGSTSGVVPRRAGPSIHRRSR
jgi:hypothetical protein